jgi:hypothetical protein
VISSSLQVRALAGLRDRSVADGDVTLNGSSVLNNAGPHMPASHSEEWRDARDALTVHPNRHCISNVNSDVAPSRETSGRIQLRDRAAAAHQAHNLGGRWFESTSRNRRTEVRHAPSRAHAGAATGSAAGDAHSREIADRAAAPRSGLASPAFGHGTSATRHGAAEPVGGSKPSAGTDGPSRHLAQAGGPSHQLRRAS